MGLTITMGIVNVVGLLIVAHVYFYLRERQFFGTKQWVAKTTVVASAVLFSGAAAATNMFINQVGILLP